MSNTTTFQAEVRTLAKVKEWSLNPRRGKYEGIPEMRESLRLFGLQDAIHVWEREDGDYLLKGHRRFRGMSEEGWTECRMVVHRFADEAEAYQFLLEDHGHTIALNPEEKITAVENGVNLGLTADDLAPRLGLSVERVQMLFDLGTMLPARGREAMAAGRMSMNVAELLVPLKDLPRRDVEEAVQLLLHDPVNDEPLTPKAAKMMLEMRFLKPRKWEADWVKMSADLKKKRHRPAEGFHFVAFADRLEYIIGDSGQPHAEFAQAHEIDGRQTFEEKAQALQVPIFVCPAPLHGDRYVLLVSKKMVRDAAKASDGQEVPLVATSGMVTTSAELADDETDGDEERLAKAADEVRDETAEQVVERHARVLKVFLAAIFEHLKLNPTDCMGQGPWRLLHKWLAWVTTDVDDGALKAWLGLDEASAVMAEIEKDKSQRNAMRWALMLMLCAESDGSSQPEALIRQMAEELGLDVAEIEARV